MILCVLIVLINVFFIRVRFEEIFVGVMLIYFFLSRLWSFSVDGVGYSKEGEEEVVVVS